MSEITLRSTILLRRATKEEWETVNPVLKQGEPGYVKNTSLLKIGNGVDNWINLPYINSELDTIVKPTKEDFPIVGNELNLYRAYEEKTLYQWNSKENRYESLSSGGSYEDITIINGGNANGTT